MTGRNSLLARLGVSPIMALGLLVTVSCGGGSSTSTTTPTTPATNNSVPLTVDFGPNGQGGGYLNDVTTTVTICPHGSTSNCQQIPNVLVDTGSVGLRILNSAFTTLQPTSLGVIQDSSDDQLQECIQYGDTSYSWGPMWLADVQIGGETASNIAIQVIGENTFTVPSQCLATPVNPNLPNGGNEDSVTTFGANGVLGIGPYPWDCGTACTDSTNLSTSGYPYYICPTGQSCQSTTIATNYQAVNPVASFSSSDNNGVVIALGSVPATGAASATGTMYFGIGTQSNNGLGSAALYALDQYAFIPTVTYNGIAYTSPNSTNVFDTGSNALYVSDASTLSSLGISDCAQGTAGEGFYCVSGGGTATLSNIALAGYSGVGSGTVSLSIADATTLLSANPTFAVYNNIGADGGSSPSNDSFDFGLPFFLGKTVFIGIAGSTVPNGASAPNGYVAF